MGRKTKQRAIMGRFIAQLLRYLTYVVASLSRQQNSSLLPEAVLSDIFAQPFSPDSHQQRHQHWPNKQTHNTHGFYAAYQTKEGRQER